MSCETSIHFLLLDTATQVQGRLTDVVEGDADSYCVLLFNSRLLLPVLLPALLCATGRAIGHDVAALLLDVNCRCCKQRIFNLLIDHGSPASMSPVSTSWMCFEPAVVCWLSLRVFLGG